MSSFERKLSQIASGGLRVWIGQSVDTSVLHSKFTEYLMLPVLTSVGCAIRRPESVKKKFDANLRGQVGAGGELMVDSGGFVLMKNPEAGWGVEDVASMYDKINVDRLVCLDHPPLPKDNAEARDAKYRATLDNLRHLQARFGDTVVPVIHGMDARERLDNAALAAELMPNPDLVALGGLVPLLQRSGQTKNDRPASPQRMLGSAISAVRSVFPNSKIHVFGVGSVHTTLGVFALGANSTDSIGWRQAAGFGSVYLPGRHRRLLTDRLSAKPCRPILNEEEREILESCKCPACRLAREQSDQVEELRKSFTLRAIHNIWVLYDEVYQFAEKRTTTCSAEFLKSRLPEAWLAAIK